MLPLLDGDGVGRSDKGGIEGGLAGTAVRGRQLADELAQGGLTGGDVALQHGEDGGRVDGLVVGVPGVVVRDGGEQRVAELGFAGELRFGEGGHADDIGSPLAVEVAFGARAEGRAFNDHVGPAFVDSRPGRPCAGGGGRAHARAERVGEGDVGDDAFAEEAGGPRAAGAVDELAGHDHLAGGERFAEAADGGDGEHAAYAERFQGPEVRALGQFRGEQGVAPAMPREEGDADAFQPAHEERVAGRAEGGVHADFLDGFEPRHLVKAGAADHRQLDFRYASHAPISSAASVGAIARGRRSLRSELSAEPTISILGGVPGRLGGIVPAAVATDFETVIGLEVHCQLTTRSKMFCGCSTDYAGAEPNTHVCAVCLGLPGVLPVINEAAIASIVLTGLALNCRISSFSKFDRKNYLYPDLMKGYQISQYDLPVALGGWLQIEVEGEAARRIGITRVHMEEDTARLLHRIDAATGEAYTLVDVNRSGTPLMEIVSEPDLRTPAEARDYLVRLRQLLRYIGVSEANMEEGNFRCDANVSLRPRGASALGTKVEVKNMNSFRAVHDALAFEEMRQAALLRGGGRIVQETRGWADERGETVSQRSKEHANDYRYFPEPDLPPLRLSAAYVDEVRARLPGLPAERRAELLALGLNGYEAATIAESRGRADYFDAVREALAGVEAARAAKLAANWVLGEVLRWQNTSGRELEELRVAPDALAELILLVEREAITAQAGKSVFETMAETGRAPGTIVEEQGLGQISGGEELRGLVQASIAANPKAVADYHAGKESAVKFLIGQVMRETKGRANPGLLQELFVAELSEK